MGRHPSGQLVACHNPQLIEKTGAAIFNFLSSCFNILTAHHYGRYAGMFFRKFARVWCSAFFSSRN